MFCKNCGAQLSDDVKFCNSCGASVSAAEPIHNNDILSTNKTQKTGSGDVLAVVKKYKKTIIAVLVMILAICIFSGGRSAEKTAEQFVEALLDGDARTAVSLMSEITIEESRYETKKLLIHALDEQLEYEREDYKNKYGDSWKYNVEVIDSYDVDFSDIEDYVEVTEYISSNLKEVAISIEHKGKGWFNDKEGAETMTITCIKQGRKWYVLYFD